MSSFAYELKKIMVCQKGALYLVLILLFSTLLLVISDHPYDSSMEQYKSEYEWYLDKVNGYCTKESAAYLEKEAEEIAEAKRRESNTLENYYDGKISEAEYNRQREENSKILEHQNGFEVIYQKYLYICENMDNRYFLQTNGWAGLLSDGTLNFLLVLGILLFVTPVFCSEYTCQMDALILTTKEGRKSTLYKLFIVVTGVLLLCIGISLAEYGFYSIRYGLPDGDYPIQSLRYFADSSKSVTLFEGYVWIALIRSFGGVFLAMLLMALSVLTKKYAITLLAGAASVLIPYTGLSKTWLYRLPLPVSFLLGTDFFSSSMISKDALTGESTAVFSEISTAMLCILLVVSAAFCMVAVICILLLHTNRWQIKARQKRKISFLVMLCVAFTMTGCSSTQENENIVYNSSADYDCMQYEVIQDMESRDYYLKNLLTGEMTDMVRSPLFGVFSEEEKVQCYCVKSPYLYYTISETNRHIDRIGSYNSSVTKVSVIELNLDTLEEKSIFEQVTDSRRSVLGIDYENGNQWEFLQYHFGFFLNDDSLFFICNDGIRQVDRLTKQVTKLDIPTNGTISFDGSSIFYKNDQSVLESYDVSNKQITIYEDMVIYDFCIDEGQIYYIARTEGYAVYVCDKDGSNIKLIYSAASMAVTCDMENIYVTDKQSGEKITLLKE